METASCSLDHSHSACPAQIVPGQDKDESMTQQKIMRHRRYLASKAFSLLGSATGSLEKHQELAASIKASCFTNGCLQGKLLLQQPCHT